MSHARRRSKKKHLSLEKQLRRFKEKQPRNLLAVAAWNRGGGNHGDARKTESRNACRNWKHGKNKGD